MKIRQAKTAIVTGGSRGIGQAIATRFRNLGWRVITISRYEAPILFHPEDEGKLHVCSDLTHIDEIAKTVEVIRPLLVGSALAALINNAGISPKGFGGTRVSSLMTDLENWERVYNINLLAPLLLTRGFSQELGNANGSVVNVCSIAGNRVHPFAGSAYATSKAALAALTREMAYDMAIQNIRVNAIVPGEIDTDMLASGTSYIVENHIPMRRLGRVDEVADLVEFLCSDKASYITGAEIPIDGGQRI